MTLTKYQAKYNFINPRLLRIIDNKKVFRFKSNESCRATIEGTELKFSELPPQSDLVLFVENRFLFYALSTEYDKYQAALEEQRIGRKHMMEQHAFSVEEKTIEITNKFYASYDLPVPASVGHIGHLNGLTANSSGNGMTRSSVHHLLITEDFNKSNIKRSKGQMLCLAAGKDYADSNQDPVTYYLPHHDKTILPVVDCKACLKIMKRWHKQTC